MASSTETDKREGGTGQDTPKVCVLSHPASRYALRDMAGHCPVLSHCPAQPVSGRERRLSAIRPIVRRGLSRVEAAMYLGISPSKFDELRKANRIAPPKILDGRLIFTVERLDDFIDSLPDEHQTDDDDWTTTL